MRPAFLHPHATSACFDDLPDYCEPKAGAGSLRRLIMLEASVRLEDPIALCWWNARAFVVDEDVEHVTMLLGAKKNPLARPSILERIVDQIDQCLSDKSGIRHHRLRRSRHDFNGLTRVLDREPDSIGDV